jgi:hypothetical protein
MRNVSQDRDLKRTKWEAVSHSKRKAASRTGPSATAAGISKAFFCSPGACELWALVLALGPVPQGIASFQRLRWLLPLACIFPLLLLLISPLPSLSFCSHSSLTLHISSSNSPGGRLSQLSSPRHAQRNQLNQPHDKLLKCLATHQKPVENSPNPEEAALFSLLLHCPSPLPTSPPCGFSCHLA